MTTDARDHLQAILDAWRATKPANRARLCVLTPLLAEKIIDADEWDVNATATKSTHTAQELREARDTLAWTPALNMAVEAAAATGVPLRDIAAAMRSLGRQE